ncbi:MAG: pyridoxal phosphate-dependent aminotransferase [bacterium]|nr:pyridoxal phosphate-dependent aminotransferase [bacterium]
MGILAARLGQMASSATVGIADQVVQLRQQGKTVIDFSAGRAFEPTPAYVSQAASDALFGGDTHQTPARGTRNYRQACAAKLARDNALKADWETEIIATMGVKQALTLALLGTVGPGDEVLIEDPCFVSYIPLVNIAGAQVRRIPLKPDNTFRWTAEQVKASITERTRAILFNSPHNPTGTVHTEADLKIIADLAAEHNLTVITDEVYERVTWDGRTHICIASLPSMRERTITCMGLTKTYSMGGWRIGFVCSSAEIIDGLTKLQQHLLTCAPSFTQAGAAVAFGEAPRPEVEEMWHEWEERCALVCEHVNTVTGFTCSKPEGGFYAWVDIKATGLTSLEISEKLLNDVQVAVVPGSAFGPTGEGYIRINCVRNRSEIPYLPTTHSRHLS